ncbi:MAG: hypothetical protein ACOX8W_02170 [bacterium]
MKLLRPLTFRSIRPTKNIPPPPLEELKGGLKKVLDENLQPSEKLRICIEGGAGEALVATDKRVMMLKAGFLAGAYRGPLCFSLNYEDIDYFKWGKRRSLEIVPYRGRKLRGCIMTFLPFQDDKFIGAVNLLADLVLAIRKKNKAKDTSNGEAGAGQLIVGSEEGGKSE